MGFNSPPRRLADAAEIVGFGDPPPKSPLLNYILKEVFFYVAFDKTIEADWFSEAYDYVPPRRGQIREGIILENEEYGLTIDVGLKRDGFVPRTDLDRLTEEKQAELEPGRTVEARVVRPEDRDGNLILSISQVQMDEDWQKATELKESGEIWTGKVFRFNSGGLLVHFGQLRGFIPASHLAQRNRRFLFGSSADRRATLESYVGQEIPLKVIDVHRGERRLILSERLAREQLKEETMARLLSELEEGQICQGQVTQLCKFGAFVDLGGAEGLIHISELAWWRVQKPGDVVQVDEELEVYVLELDHKRQQINLSLRRARPNPWDTVEETYQVGQLVQGKVTNVVDFGAFVVLESGIEGLVHVSELGDGSPEEVTRIGEELILRIIEIDAFRQRMGLSLKRVGEEERAAFGDEEAKQPEEEEPAAESAKAGAEAGEKEMFWQNVLEQYRDEPAIVN